MRMRERAFDLSRFQLVPRLPPHMPKRQCTQDARKVYEVAADKPSPRSKSPYRRPSRPTSTVMHDSSTMRQQPRMRDERLFGEGKVKNSRI